MKNSLSILFILFTSTISFGQEIPLEDFMSSPYVSSLISSPSGEMVAWVSEEKGVRNLYIANSPNLKPTLIYTTGSDDGQVIGNIQIDNLDNNIFFTKGSGTNRAGEIANPASLSNYPKKQLLKYNLTSAKLDTIGSYSNYIISPKDDYLLIPKRNTILKYDLESNKVTTLISMRGNVGQLAFSPTGNEIIFTSNRNDHSFIGYYKYGDDRITWLSPYVDHDSNPQWSPDGSSVVFIRKPGTKKGELLNITGGNPFSIIVHNISSNTSKSLWTSPSDDGGFAQYYPSNPLMWALNGDILFYSEHEGWMKIYKISESNSQVIPLIEGQCEIEHSSIDASGTKVIMSHNCSEIDKRDISVYDLTHNRITQNINSVAIETNPYILKDKSIIFRKSTYNKSTGVSRVVAMKNEDIYPAKMSADFPAERFVEPEQVIFTAEDGLKIHGQLFVKDKNGKKPGLLFMHGGPIRQMLLGVHYSGYYANAYIMNQYLANQGYAVISVNYRAGIGYGKAFRRAEGQGPRGASEYQDIVAAGKYLQSLPYIDSERIGLWGGSYGGLLTAQGLGRDSDLFKAGVDFHGVHDWSWRATDFSPGGAWGITPNLMEIAFNSSPVNDVEGWKSPVLFIHGDDDRNVMFGQTIDLVRRLRDKKVEHEILVLPDEVHGFYRWESWLQSYKATARFFNKHLK